MAADEPPPRRRMVRAPTGGDPAGRGRGEKVRTAADRTLSSQAWLSRQLKDPYVQRAKAEGWRSRAAFKLLEIDARLHLLRRGARRAAGCRRR
jgi:23S rRNA (uridine2552-2'-O)-methyltransferase